MGIRGIMDTKRSSQLDNSSAKRPEGAGPGGRLAWPPEEGGRNRLVERLKREEPEVLALVLEHFKSGDKEAAELLVRTFYPYAERLVIALEKRDSQNKAQPQGGIAPALTSLGSKRSEFLNDFFAQLVSQAGELDLSQGIKLYIYERKTSPELAAMFDVSPSTIRNWIARLRRRAEAAGTVVPKREPKSKS